MESKISPANKKLMQSEFLRVLEVEAQSLGALFQYYREEKGSGFLSFTRALELLVESKGKIVTSGMGKSGAIAKKATATFTSTGSPSVFLHPSEALHGDIGIVNREDIFLVFGKSGESQEISSLPPAIKTRGVKVICITSRADSSLARASDCVMLTPLEREACPHDLVPTSSSLLALALADALALSLMRYRSFGAEQFANNHPAGALGYRLKFKVRDLMIPLSQHPPLDPRKCTIEKVISHLGTVGMVLFSEDNQKLSGIMTDGDIRRALEKFKASIFQVNLYDIMNVKPMSIDSELPAFEALKFMEGRERPLNAVPVTSQGKIAGVLRLHDLLKS